MIALNDFKAEPAALRDAELQAVERVLRSGWYVLGPEVAAFEAGWAAACGTAHAVGVANGMDAIEIGLRALGIGAGDEVITTGMTAVATVLAIRRAGATPVLADIDPATALLDRASVQRCLGPRTKALLLVHLYGQVRDLDGWDAWARDAGVLLLEDCAQAHLAAWNGRPAGSVGRFGACSFYPTKNLGAIGDAGAIVTGDADLAERARVLRNYGQSTRYVHTVEGLNSRLDEIQAALLQVRQRWLAEFTLRRQAIAARYRAGIRNPRVGLLAAPAQPGSHVHHLFVVTTPGREALMAHLQAHGVQSLIHYPVPVHQQVPYASLARDPQGLSATERHAATCLSIPCHPQMADADADRVIDALNRYGEH
ncbi:MAG: DegT/DnrJ/EryC1/StrS family aminotransferase [Pseudomonadota bacterium]